MKKSSRRQGCRTTGRKTLGNDSRSQKNSDCWYEQHLQLICLLFFNILSSKTQASSSSSSSQFKSPSISCGGLTTPFFVYSSNSLRSTFRRSHSSPVLIQSTLHISSSSTGEPPIHQFIANFPNTLLFRHRYCKLKCISRTLFMNFLEHFQIVHFILEGCAKVNYFIPLLQLFVALNNLNFYLVFMQYYSYLIGNGTHKINSNC